MAKAKRKKAAEKNTLRRIRVPAKRLVKLAGIEQVVPVAGSNAKIRKDQIDVFLAQLAEVPNVSLAAAVAGISTSMVYKLRRTDPDFAEAFQEARDLSIGKFEAEAVRRAVSGCDRVRYHKDGTIAEAWTEYSDTLMTKILGAHHPAYRRNENPLDPENVRAAGRTWLDMMKETLDQPEDKPELPPGPRVETLPPLRTPADEHFEDD